MTHLATIVSALVLFAFTYIQSQPASAQSAELLAVYKQIQSLSKQGKYAQAIPFAKTFIVLAKAEFGESHQYYALGLNNLAGLYRDQGRYLEAELLYKRSLEIREEALGPDHPSVATLLNNLLLLYNAQGRYGDAEPLLKRSLAIFEKDLGPEHPDVAVSLNNLAFLLTRPAKFILAGKPRS